MRIASICRGGTPLPKKVMLVVSIAALLVLAMVSIAYAEASSGYAVWSAGGSNAGTSATPHKDYRTTTVKCAVCHAVHKAAPGELLLDGTAGGSCLYCHVDGGTGLVRIYGGDQGQYQNFGNQYSHTDSGAGTQVGSRCTDCHAVHGANTMSYPEVDKFILKSSAVATGAAGEHADQQATAAARAVAGDKQSQIDAFCSMCHPYAQYDYNGTITVEQYRASGDVQPGGAVGNSAVYQSHVMTGTKAAYANSAGTYKGQVAWVGSEHCRNCHDAGETDTQFGRGIAGAGLGYIVESSYPHYTPNYTRFLMSGGDAAPPALGQTTYVPAGVTSDAMTDGVCLKCHRSSSAPATDGVGVNF
jgi:predicted CXXCH cytochrome family protein